MNTESDLRAILADEARDISEPADIMARVVVRPGRSRHRWVAPIAAAAAVAAVVAGAVALTGTRHHARPATTPGSPVATQRREEPTGGQTLPAMTGRQYRYTATVGNVAGYYTGDRYLVDDREITEIQLTDREGLAAGHVCVYAPGRYDPTLLKLGRKVTVQGHTAYFQETRDVLAADDQIPNVPYVPSLGWEMAPNQWIIVQGWNSAGSPPMEKHHFDPLTEMMKVAAATRVGVSEPLLIPFKVGYLPAGLHRSGGQASWWYGRADEWKGSVTLAAVPDTWETRLGITLENYHPFQPTFTLDGHPARYEGSVKSERGLQNQLYVNYGHDRYLFINGLYPREELIKIAKSITLASNVLDKSTWFDATK